MKKIFTLLLLPISTLSIAQTPLIKDVKGKAVGNTIGEFTAATKDNQTYKLSDNLSKGPTVVIFMRGPWSGYCNNHMAQLQYIFSQIAAAGANAVVLSPEKPEYL